MKSGSVLFIRGDVSEAKKINLIFYLCNKKDSKSIMDYSALAKSYNTLDYPYKLRETLKAFYKSDDYNHLTKYELIKTINKTLINNYEGEQVIKYKLAKEFIKKNYVAAFEVRAKNSRADFLVINGFTQSFEVKSKIDNLNRLGKQASAYGDVFEFNTVVTDPIHLDAVKGILPAHYGIWCFEGKKKIVYREAKFSPNLCSREQLCLFNKKELYFHFNQTDIELIVERSSKEEINANLKAALKKRYSARWTFVQSNWGRIFPIDVQFFFNTNIRPELIYS